MIWKEHMLSTKQLKRMTKLNLIDEWDLLCSMIELSYNKDKEKTKMYQECLQQIKDELAERWIDYRTMKEIY